MDEKREYEQQQFVESVIAALHRATRDDGDDYVRKFAMLVAFCMVEATKKEEWTDSSGGFPAVRPMFEEHVLEPMDLFAKDDPERRLLFGTIAKKMLDNSIMPALYRPVSWEWAEQQFAR